MADTNTVVVLPRALATKAKAATPGSGQDSGSTIPRTRESLVFDNIRTLRDSGQKIPALRKLARIDGITSSATFSFVSAAMSGYTVTAYKTGTHQFDAAGTDLARAVISSFDTLYDYSKGYADKNTLDTILATALRETVLTGGLGAELVLNKMRLPDRINIIDYSSLTWTVRADGTKFPKQVSSSGDIPLNIPTFFVAELQKEASESYAAPMIESALTDVFRLRGFSEDLEKVIRRAGHSRIIVELDGEKVRLAAPAEVAQDPEKLSAFMTQTQDDIASVISALEPEDALILFDLAKVSALSSEGEKADYKELLASLSGMTSTALKSMPSVIGLRLAGSQSLSNVESLIYLKTIKAVQNPVEQVMSRIITLAVRLYGSDTAVKFNFNDIDLRPEAELESFRVMRQQRVLQQLSLGLISDEKCAELLETGTRPPGAPDLSGTMFLDNNGGALDEAGNPSAENDPMGNQLQPDTPQHGGGGSQ